VVGIEFMGGDAVLHLALGGQKYHRPGVGNPVTARNIETVTVGQQAVNDQHIATVGHAPSHVTGNRAHAIGREVFQVEQVAQRIPKIGFVLDQKDFESHLGLTREFWVRTAPTVMRDTKDYQNLHRKSILFASQSLPILIIFQVNPV
jgi:hypothetical protein